MLQFPSQLRLLLVSILHSGQSNNARVTAGLITPTIDVFAMEEERLWSVVMSIVKGMGRCFGLLAMSGGIVAFETCGPVQICSVLTYAFLCSWTEVKREPKKYKPPSKDQLQRAKDRANSSEVHGGRPTGVTTCECGC